MRRLAPAFLIAAFVWMALASCKGSTNGSTTTTAGSCVSPLASCGPSTDPCCSGVCVSGGCVCKNTGDSCGSATECCSGVCNGTCAPVCVSSSCDPTSAPCCSGVCQPDGSCKQVCKNTNDTCNSPVECCTGICTGGKCADQTCLASGSSCTAGPGNNCCSTLCSGTPSTTCQAVPPSPGSLTCKTIGELCPNGDADCCSQNCVNGKCARAYTCQADGDLCSFNGDCCGNTCKDASGTVLTAPTGVVGRCVDPSGGCIQDGNPCALSGGKCCTGLCRDPGSGAAVCIPATGCRVTGDWCTATVDCCGGSTSNSVTCEAQLGNRCDQGQACNAPGVTCGAPVLPGGGHIPASQDCCDGKKEVCKLDSSGIPRCFGGGSPTCPTGYDPTIPSCCIQAGQACEFRDQCCNYEPCVLATPTATKKTCAAVSSCLPLGGVCTGAPPDNCCDGTTCQATEAGFACQSAAPSCNVNGVACTTASNCCSGICTGTPSQCAACKANGDACTAGTQCCSQICDATGHCAAPLACQQKDGLCASSQDCCSGLNCAIPAGQLTGTCQSSACSGAGAACSAAQPCCAGLDCDNIGSYTFCDGTTACVCKYAG